VTSFQTLAANGLLMTDPAAVGQIHTFHGASDWPGAWTTPDGLKDCQRSPRMG
jgi:hypothetical protein